MSRKETQLLAALQGYLPRGGFHGGLKEDLAKLLTEQLGPAFSFELWKAATARPEELLKKLPSPGVYVVLSLPPIESKAVCEIDPVMTHALLDKLLGGGGEPLTMIRPMTEIEQGVFSYLLLKILSRIHERAGRSAKVHFRLEGIRSSVEEIVKVLPAKEAVVVLTYRLGLEERSGVMRLLLPSPFIQKVFLDATTSPTAEEREIYEERLRRLEFLPVPAWAEAGRSNVPAKALGKLRRGDTLLLDQATVRPSEGTWKGEVLLRVGTGRSGSWRAKILSSKPFQVEIVGPGGGS